MREKKVKIIATEELEEWKLRPLIGRSGVIVATTNKGSWVRLNKPYLQEEEWFIPKKSLQKVP